MIGDRVFKFPDGNGGFILKIRDEEGKWHVCDATGNYLEEEKDEPAKEASPRRSRKEHKKSIAPKDGCIRIPVSFSKEELELLYDYLGWRFCSEHKDIPLSKIISQAVLDMIRHDSKFKEFRKKIGE